ncbi:hypothetical protein GE09DRAFT_1211457 [Coniochaeta sp. 2T2.1]|nr:hypothetical protein GE09DRAFT_1211457 [Coniochaeta sp. 2T2.1]
MATNTFCPTDRIPDIVSLPVPQNINLIIVPGSDATYPSMVSCCQPNKVEIVTRCWLWCEIPKSVFNGTDEKGAQYLTKICLKNHGRESNDLAGSITGWQFNAGIRAGTAGTMKQMDVWMLSISGWIYLM